MGHGGLLKTSILTALVWILLFNNPSMAMTEQPVFATSFEHNDPQFHILSGCKVQKEISRTGHDALGCQRGQASLISKVAITEMGLLEFWVKPLHPQTSYRINVLTSPAVQLDSPWTQVALIEQQAGNTEYLAHRISIDDPGRKFLRFDIEAVHGDLALDDVQLAKILLDTALQKNEQRIIGEILSQLNSTKNKQIQAESLQALGKNYAHQLESQRQYLEYANAIYSSINFVLASSERHKMANPMAYATFRSILEDVKRVASPLQKARLNSMVKPFGDLMTATLTVASAGAYVAFAEPFKSFLAATFDRSNYENADLSRKDRRFAEENGLKVYEKAEKFLNELERELTQVTALEQDLQLMLKNVESFRRDLDKHIRDYLHYAGLARTQENYSRVMSKEENNRLQVRQEVEHNIRQRAHHLLMAENSTELVQFMLRTSEKLDGMQAFKERFNQLTAQSITFYDRFERSVASDQNPFSDAKDKAAWESHAKKARDYIRHSKEGFREAYL